MSTGRKFPVRSVDRRHELTGSIYSLGSKLDPFTASFQMGIDILAIWLRYMLGLWSIRPKSD